ncbi:PH domain-containing protein [Haladaptatus pallidirubidus]|uniref:PH domain-containing protein n=1 Tax=Haladaptatus pallidirubidus TaxID=1008152 RepID=UPI001D118263|nr:PH domain-containing protein [Haladaptatus pallidirubidus]
MVNDFDASWLHRTPDEEILWRGHQSVYRILPLVTVGVLFVLLGAGLAGSNFFPLANWIGVILVLIGLIIAIPPLLKWRTEWYVLTTEEIYHKKGILSTNTIQIRLDRIQNTTYSQSLIERIFNYGDVTVYTAGSGTMDLVFANVPNPQLVNSILTDQLDRVSMK